MKKRISVLAGLSAVCLIFGLAGCMSRGARTFEFYCGGELYRQVRVEAGEHALRELVEDPVKSPEGEKFYTFEGWSATEGGAVTERAEADADKAFYAVFSETERELFTVVFVDEWEGERTVLSTLRVARGEKAVPPETLPAHEGWSFTGWDRDPADTPVEGRTEFKAVYARNRYPLTLDVAGKQTVKEVLFGEALPLEDPALPAPLRFTGWRLENSAPAAVTMPASPLTVYAGIEADFSSVRLRGENFVYGGENRVEIAGLAAGEGVEYTYEWGNGETDSSVLLREAGEYELTLTLVLRYGAFTCPHVLEGTFSVAKKFVSAKILPEESSVVYGEPPALSFVAEGLLDGDEPPAVEFLFDGEKTERLNAGSYTVTASMEEQRNYEFSRIDSARLEVEKKPLTATAVVADLVYGETPDPVVSFEGFLPGEGEETLSLHGSAVRYLREGSPAEGQLSAGEYSVEVADGAYSARNYTVTPAPATTFTVARKEVSVTLSPMEATYGDPLPAPVATVSGLLPSDAALRPQILSALSYTFGDGTSDGDLPAGEYAVKPRLQDAFLNYHIVCADGALTVAKRELPLSSGDVSQNRNRRWTMDAVLPAGDGEKFEIAGKIALDSTDAGVYLATDEETFAENRFVWEEPLSVTRKGGGDVTENFSVRYALSVTLNNSRFDVTVPSEGLRFVYDGREHVFAVIATPDQSDENALPPAIVYTVNGGDSASAAPSFCNAGRYEVVCEISAPNYETERRSFTVEIDKAEYGVTAEEQNYVYAPYTSFGEGVTVSAAQGNEYTVTYVYEREGTHSSTAAPRFSEAIPEGVEISYTVSEGENYLPAEGSYTVRVAKAAGELDLSGVRRRYVYNGEAQRVEGGATSNNREDGQIFYENNVFTTVEEGNALRVTVRLAEGKNYTGDEKTVSDVTVEKQTFSSLPAGIAVPKPDEKVNRMGATLTGVELPEDFRWANPDGALRIGSHAYAAFYNPDRANCNDLSVEIVFPVRRERLAAAIFGGESATGEEISSYADFTLTGEDGRTAEEERGLVALVSDGSDVREEGGTYPVACTLTRTENDYFELYFGGVKTEKAEAVVPYKRKTVEVSGEYYTVEDALARLESGGTATVKRNAAFLSEEGRRAFSDDPYPEAKYRTVAHGATLLVPYGEGDSGTTAQKSKRAFAAVAEKGYSSLALAAGELLIEGTLIVNAERSSDGSLTSMIVGDKYGELNVPSGACVRVKEGGVFESMGFTYGDGEVVAERGSDLYEPFAMVGWKGGAISAAVREQVFPLNQYALPSLICRTRIQAGAQYSVRASLSATLSIFFGEQNFDLPLAFVGEGENSFLRLTEGEAVKWVNEEDGKICFDLAGKVSFRNLELALSETIKFDTSGLQVPVPGNFSLTLKEGSRAEIPDGVAIKLLPGAEATIEAGAELVLREGGALYGYGEGVTFDSGLARFQDGGNGLSYPHAKLGAAYRRSVGAFGYDSSSAAKTVVKGKLTAESGATLAAELTKEEGAEISVAEGAVLGGTLREDKTPAITSTTGKLQALSGKGGVYFTATFPAREE